MSFYNSMHGTTSATFFILPMLGKHPDEYPRFRDCFTNDKEYPEYKDHIHVYTRVGGGNRNCGLGEEELRKHPNYVTDFDDSFDSTFATYVFSVPKEWQDDFNKIKANNILKISDAYKKQLYTIYPKLSQEFDELFNKEKADQD